MNLKELTLKSVILLALATAQRNQIISKIKVNNIRCTDSEMEIYIKELTKTSRPGVKQPCLILPKFTQDPKICVYSTIKHYMERTKELRTENSYLFISYVNPHVSVGTQTLARWIKTVLEKAGIDISMFKAHSTRHASTSAALAKGVDLETINKSVGWSEKSSVFAKFYNRSIVKKDNVYLRKLFEQKKSN